MLQPPIVQKTVITYFQSRDHFLRLLEKNPGLIIIKMGATWCGPCKKIKPVVDAFFASSPDNVICCEIDVDESFDLYAYYKNKKMVNGIPVILCYKKGIQLIFLMIQLLDPILFNWIHFLKDVVCI